MTTEENQGKKLLEHRQRVGKCPICGDSNRINKEFSSFVNNEKKNEDGSLMTEEEVRAELIKRADKWKPNYTHDRCKGHMDRLYG